MELKQKTILIYIWDMGIGGVQKRVRDIIFHLAEYYPEYHVELLIKRAYSTPLLKEVAKAKNTKICYFSTSSEKIWWPSIFWVAQQYLLIKPNIVLTFLDRLSVQMILMKKIFWWRKVKLVLSEEIYTTNFLIMKENVFWKKMVKMFYPMADLVIALTKKIQKDLNKNYGVSLSKIKVIPNWTLVLPPKKNNLKIYDFIYLGRLEKEKNIFWLVDLIKILKKDANISLCILGKGILKKELIRRIKVEKLEKNIFYYGFQENIKKYLNKAKILLLPSLNEGMPNCILEAGIYRIPAIVYNFKGANEVVIHGKTGYIAKDKKEFFYYAQKLLKEDKLKIKMGTVVQQIVQKNFGERNLKKYLNILIS